MSLADFANGLVTGRFSLEPSPAGCTRGDHAVLDTEEDPKVLKVLKLQRANVTYKVRCVSSSRISSALRCMPWFKISPEHELPRP